MDTRGYNLSDKPEGVDNYRIEHLLADINAIIDDLGVSRRSTWWDTTGVAPSCWRFAMAHPDRVARLIVLNLTHPKGYASVIANPTAEQQSNVEYARNFAASEATGEPVPDRVMAIGELSGDPAVADRYREAFAQVILGRHDELLSSQLRRSGGS